MGVMEACGGLEVDGNRMVRGTDEVFRFKIASALAWAYPSSYHLCEGGGVNARRLVRRGLQSVQVGFLIVAGPYPRDEPGVELGGRRELPNMGFGVSSHD